MFSTLFQCVIGISLAHQSQQIDMEGAIWPALAPRIWKTDDSSDHVGEATHYNKKVNVTEINWKDVFNRDQDIAKTLRQNAKVLLDEKMRSADFTNRTIMNQLNAEKTKAQLTQLKDYLQEVSTTLWKNRTDQRSKDMDSDDHQNGQRRISPSGCLLFTILFLSYGVFNIQFVT